jgi:CRISPR-associated protein Csh1
MQEGKKETYDMKFDFSILKNFFPSNKIEGNWDKDFLNSMYSIFIDEKINYQFMIDSFIRIIRPKFAKEETIYLDCLKSLLLLKFLINSKLIENGGEKMSEESDSYFKFLNEHDDVLNTVEKKGVFLLGVLVNKLLNIQLQDRNSKPFYGRLNGLKINEDIAKRIFPEVINKLNEYDKNFYTKLENRISELFVESDFNELSNNEISYYFVLGMNLSNNFKKEKMIKMDGEDKSDE